MSSRGARGSFYSSRGNYSLASTGFDKSSHRSHSQGMMSRDRFSHANLSNVNEDTNDALED